LASATSAYSPSVMMRTQRPRVFCVSGTLHASYILLFSPQLSFFSYRSYIVGWLSPDFS
jgi:hypothetical protein